MASETKQIFRPKHLTAEDIKEGCVTLYGDNNEETKLCMIQEEFRQGIDTIQAFGRSVTFYGSARLSEDHPAYKAARNLSFRIAKELGYAILSGGGPGIMEAANRGAFEAGGKSVGLTIKLAHEQITNPYLTDEIPFYFFFARQTSMSYTTEACVFFTGGFGTFDELFEMLTLKQTRKIGDVPIILVGKEFWNPLQEVILKNLLQKYKTVSPNDVALYTITDNEEEILQIIKESKLRTGLDVL